MSFNGEYMYQYKVEKMSCMSCFRNIDEAVKEVDAKATLSVNMEQKLVSIQTELSAEKVQDVITEAGYPAEALEV